MHHFIFPTQDSWISSGSDTTTGESFKNQNFGRDQILEVKKFFYNNEFNYQTRALINFAGTDFNEMSNSIVAGDIDNPRFYLKLYEAEGNSELSEDYTLDFQPISESWSEGTGKFGDRPKNTNGCSWENRQNPIGSTEITWSNRAVLGQTLASGALTISSGDIMDEEVTIGGVDFIFVEDTTNYDNNSNELFVTSGSSVDTSAQNLREIINNNTSTHGLSISASHSETGRLELTGSATGSLANLGAASSSALFSFNGNQAKAVEGGTDRRGGLGGNGNTTVPVSSSAQSFSNESPDVDVEITDMVKGWLSGSIDNYGIQVRFSGSQETDSNTFGHLKFFSRDTHTIYAPKLEVRWEDSSYNTGDLTELSMSGEVDNYLYMKGLRESYKENERVKFRIGARKRYIQKSFSTSVQTTSGSYVPQGSGSYAIKDIATDEYIVPFSAYTSMSCDTNSNYFVQWLDGFYPDRTYKILLKLKYNDNQEQIFDDDFEFNVKRS